MAASKKKKKTDCSLGDAAKALGISYRHCRRLAATGDLKARNVAPAGAKPSWQVSRQALTALKKRRTA